MNRRGFLRAFGLAPAVAVMGAGPLGVLAEAANAAHAGEPCITGGAYWHEYRTFRGSMGRVWIDSPFLIETGAPTKSGDIPIKAVKRCACDRHKLHVSRLVAGARNEALPARQRVFGLLHDCGVVGAERDEHGEHAFERVHAGHHGEDQLVLGHVGSPVGGPELEPSRAGVRPATEVFPNVREPGADATGRAAKGPSIAARPVSRGASS